MSSTANVRWRRPGAFAGACRSPSGPGGAWNFDQLEPSVAVRRLHHRDVRPRRPRARRCGRPHRPRPTPAPCSSSPSSTKNAIAAARSSTTMPTWSMRWIVMRSTGRGGSRAGGLADQVVALGDVRGPAGGLGVGRRRRRGGRRRARAGGRGRRASGAGRRSRRAAGRSRAARRRRRATWPTATARPSTAAGSWRTGSSVRATRSSYQARICGQSVSSALAASSCRAAMAASIW